MFFNVPMVFGLLATAVLAAPAQQPRSTSSSSPSSGKRGLCYNDPKAVAAFKGTAADSWTYNWGSSPDGDEGSDFVPMLWGPKFFNGWESTSRKVLSSGRKFVLGFNEPDHGEQAYMSPPSAVDAFKKYLTPLANKVSLGSPAVTNGGGDMGLTWMRSFLDTCGSNCGINFLAVHWYSPATEIEGFKQHMNKAIDLAKSHGIDQVWLTEFQGLGDDQAQINFLKEALPWLNANPAVARYSYFMADTMVSGGQLNAVGKAYVAA
ncbi:hypothetical protein LOZ61_002833 [Ophidiomyces ophidiicola]|nr:hypothetical protein LOZ61_002833 [Ophidiomyces ophidiicola]KAI1931220.1 hypothetical protein LOZ60_000422 [Ophidiomyces ophidiicola]KAI2148843.1 hypothetical protein LOZ27_001369 [Ophidiomyces ophidiicola]KAI2405398.1 hypothetical protein LOY90_004045 [Ophidiomyces ophidiicola]